jgi:predicted aldo/keto reductase-like oxidoreductase
MSNHHDRRQGALDRRAFLKRSAAAGVGLAVAGSLRADEASQPAELPTRVLGRTGRKVTILGLGTAPRGEFRGDLQDAVNVFQAALDRGVNYVDTARIYGNAEEALGHLVPKLRDKLFLVTKCSTDNAREAERSLAESLRQLKTDHVDLCHIHAIGDKNLDRVTADDGVLPFLVKQKQAGKVRHIGISGHSRPGNFLKMIATGEIDVVMCVMNYADRHVYDFETKVLPEARRRNLGVAAMKVYVGIKGGFPNHRRGQVGCVTEPERLPQALAYALDLEGVHVAVVGPFTVEQSIRNVELALQYKPLTEPQRAALLARGRELAGQLGPRYGPLQ